VRAIYPSEASKVAVFVDFLAELLAENGRLIYSPEWRLYAPVSESNTATRGLPQPSATKTSLAAVSTAMSLLDRKYHQGGAADSLLHCGISALSPRRFTSGLGQSRVRRE